MPRINAKSLAEHHTRSMSALALAFDSCLIDKPYDSISMAEVASRAGMARNTLYNYAKDKSELITLVIGHAAVTLITEVDTLSSSDLEPVEKLAGIVRAVMGWVATGQYRALIAYAISQSWGAEGDALLGQKIRSVIWQTVSEGVERGIYRKDFLLALELLSGTARAAAARILICPAEMESISSEAIRLLNAGLQPDDQCYLLAKR